MFSWRQNKLDKDSLGFEKNFCCSHSWRHVRHPAPQRDEPRSPEKRVRQDARRFRAQVAKGGWPVGPQRRRGPTRGPRQPRARQLPMQIRLHERISTYRTVPDAAGGDHRELVNSELCREHEQLRHQDRVSERLPTEKPPRLEILLKFLLNLILTGPGWEAHQCSSTTTSVIFPVGSRIVDFAHCRRAVILTFLP